MKSNCSTVSFRRFISFVPIVFLFALVIGFLATPVKAEVFTVTTLSDDVPGSLRAAIASADSYDDVISFDVTGTIKLNSQLQIHNGMKINGPGPDLLAVSGGGACRVFYIDTRASVDISGISIASGDASRSGGGGIYNHESDTKIMNCTFTGNSAYSGGAIFNTDSSPEVTKCTFSSNSGIYSGGGMCNLRNFTDQASPIVTNCTFSSNSAGIGAGMYNEDCSPEVSNCTFTLNSADRWGGGMFNFKVSCTVTNCTFSGNSANSGGGMDNIESDSTVTNCTFGLNSAVEDGGGMRNQSSSLPMNNCTFYHNTAIIGGGMYNNYSSPEVTNCIFWNDTGGEIHNDSSTTTLSYCVVQSDDYDGSTISEYVTSADPMLGPLSDNGGPTWTCALGEDSSAIDAGMTIAEVSTDQRGAPKPFNGGSFDIGAYESGLEVYEITATCSDGGSISPTKAHTLAGIEDEVFYLVPAEGYEIEVVYVDDSAVSYDEASNTYTFHNVSANHVFSADFQPSADDDMTGGNLDGCNISALSGMGLLLVLPLMFLSGKMK